jgi:hypothetical protein
VFPLTFVDASLWFIVLTAIVLLATEVVDATHGSVSLMIDACRLKRVVRVLSYLLLVVIAINVYLLL